MKKQALIFSGSAILAALCCYSQTVAVKRRVVIGTPTVSTPTTSNSGGSCTGSDGAGWSCASATTVSLADSTGGATICYTTDGSTPAAATPGTCSHGTTYSTGFSVSSTTTVKALGTEIGFNNSSVLTTTYTISGAPISQVGSTATAGVSSSGGTATTTGFDTTGATLLVITVTSEADTTTATVLDSNSNTWTHLPTIGPFGSVYIGIWYSYNKSGGALVTGAGHTVSVTGVFATITFSAWKNTMTGSNDPYDSTAGQISANNTSSPTLTPANLTPSVNNSLLISSSYASGVVSESCSPFTFSAIAANVLDSMMGYQIQTTATGAAPTWNYGQTSGTNIANIVSFKHQ